MMYDPPHPGEILRQDYLEPLGLSVTEAAACLQRGHQDGMRCQEPTG